MWNKEIIIYMAGIIDGEGSILIDLQSPNATRKYHYFSIRLVVINTSSELMDWLVKNFGGKARSRKRITNRKQCYSWVLFSKNAIDIVEACLPYLIIKKQHALVLKEFWETVGKTGWNITEEVREHRKFLYDKIRKLNKPSDESPIDPCALSPSPLR